ncbi:MAG: hypothetical protein JWN31_853 [Frankiales bacterium]|nr:hypothetical protein [Frankiales bacterium]
MHRFSPGDSRDIAYISTFIDVPSTVAAARFDGLLTSLPQGCGVLLLDATSPSSSSPRCASGALRSIRGRTLAAVTIELDVWSEGRPQLGIRPLRSKSGSPAGYFAAGYAVLEELAQALAVESPGTPALIGRKAPLVAGRRTRSAMQPA